VPTPHVTLWAQRHQHWLRHLERTNIPSFRFELPDGPRLRVLPDWRRPVPVNVATSVSERSRPAPP